VSAERLEVHPTRLELLRLKRRKTLAEGIADILQKDLEALMISLIEHRERASILRAQLDDALAQSYNQFIEAEMAIGNLKVKELALTEQDQIKKQVKQDLRPRLSVLDAPIQLEMAASAITEVMNAITQIASLTAAIRELLEVISLKRRQINRIQFKIIPQLDATVVFVEQILKEIEQQDAIRVRVLQRKRKERVEKFIETN